jgi:GTPase Era involved in 16S rRNA processing
MYNKRAMKIGDIKYILKDEVPSNIDIDTIEIEISADESGTWDVKRIIYIEEENVLRILV